ncbi:hypothetical protein BGX28_005177 [Mortierella sp. GBA30]|nr:hypothetical protein BGX28_005177 [Mortierella sp. GBA30]
MEAATHAPTFPTKLRWRPYVNGNSLKSKKIKKDDLQSHTHQNQQPKSITQDLNAKTLAYKIRGKPLHQKSPIQVQLQWEEAETIESMSHGGHPHNQHPHPHHHQHHRNNAEAGTKHLSNDPVHRNMVSLPSPPQSKSPSFGLALIDGQDPDMRQYKATVPALQGNDLSPLPSAEANAVCRVALEALLENHRKNQMLAAQSALAFALTSATVPISVTDSARTHPAVIRSGSSNIDTGRLSSAELLSMANIDELLSNVSDPESSDHFSTAASTLASPATTDQSLHSSPINGLMDILGTQTAITSHLEITDAMFGMMVAQAPLLLRDGDCKKVLLNHRQQQQPQTISPTLSDTSTTAHPIVEFFQDLTAPFTASQSDPLINGNNSSPWPSLFPKPNESSPAAEVASNAEIIVSQTEVSTDDEKLPSSYRIPSSDSPVTRLSQTEHDPDSAEWLAFLDEASPLFSGETDISDTPSMDPASPTAPRESHAQSTDTKQTNTGLWDWTGDISKPGVMTSRSSSSAFAISGPLGAGGLVRTLRGNYQQKSGYHTKAQAPASRTDALAASPSAFEKRILKVVCDDSKRTIVKAPDAAAAETQELRGSRRTPPQRTYVNHSKIAKDGVDKSEAENFKGLMALFHGLWRASTGERS